MTIKMEGSIPFPQGALSRLYQKPQYLTQHLSVVGSRIKPLEHPLNVCEEEGPLAMDMSGIPHRTSHLILDSPGWLVRLRWGHLWLLWVVMVPSMVMRMVWWLWCP